jgi:hypothetical protein
MSEIEAKGKKVNLLENSRSIKTSQLGSKRKELVN